jgi:hypothetical protein
MIDIGPNLYELIRIAIITFGIVAVVYIINRRLK